jgi:hypothetical protein
LPGGTLHQGVYRHYHGAANGRCIRAQSSKFKAEREVDEIYRAVRLKSFWIFNDMYLFTAKTQRTQRFIYFLFSGDPPKMTADRKTGKQKEPALSSKSHCQGQL